MRLLFAIQELPFGGAERVVAALHAGAQRAGHDVSVAAAPGALGSELGVPIHPLPVLGRRVTRLPTGVMALRRALAAARPNLVHCHNPGVALLASLATRRGRRPPTIATMHGVPDQDYGLAAKVLRFAGLPTIACGPGVAAALMDAGFRVQDTIVNGVAPAPPSADRAALVEEWQIPTGTRLLLSIGRLVEQKNHALAIRALEQVPNATLVILGEGPLREELEIEAGKANVQSRVVFAGTRADSRAVIGAADALVLSSHWEGLPLVALEALAAGTPVVATDVRGVRELLTHERNSLLVRASDPVALAEGISRLFREHSLADRLVREGRALASLHTEERMIERYLQLYEEHMR